MLACHVSHAVFINRLLSIRGGRRDGWYSFNDIKSKIETFTGGSWETEQVETTMRMPILYLAERSGWDILPRRVSSRDAPVQLADFDDVIEACAQTLNQSLLVCSASSP